MIKKDTLVIIAAAAVGLIFIARVAKGKGFGTFGMGLHDSGGTSPSSTGAGRAEAITNTAQAGQQGWGWQYFTDGTVIDPKGVYYKNGNEVYNPAGILGASN